MTTWSIIEDRLVQACRDASVAAVACISPAIWASCDLSIGHVFTGLRGYIGARNRGRLPFIEIFRSAPTSFENTSISSNHEGFEITQFTIRIHVSGLKPNQAELDLQKLARQCLIKIRSNTSDHYLQYGDEIMRDIISSPIGYYGDIEGNVKHTFSRDNYNE